MHAVLGVLGVLGLCSSVADELLQILAFFIVTSKIANGLSPVGDDSWTSNSIQ